MPWQRSRRIGGRAEYAPARSAPAAGSRAREDRQENQAARLTRKKGRVAGSRVRKLGKKHPVFVAAAPGAGWHVFGPSEKVVPNGYCEVRRKDGTDVRVLLGPIVRRRGPLVVCEVVTDDRLR